MPLSNLFYAKKSSTGRQYIVSHLLLMNLASQLKTSIEGPKVFCLLNLYISLKFAPCIFCIHGVLLFGHFFSLNKRNYSIIPSIKTNIKFRTDNLNGIYVNKQFLRHYFQMVRQRVYQIGTCLSVTLTENLDPMITSLKSVE